MDMREGGGGKERERERWGRKKEGEGGRNERERQRGGGVRCDIVLKLPATCISLPCLQLVDIV